MKSASQGMQFGNSFSKSRLPCACGGAAEAVLPLWCTAIYYSVTLDKLDKREENNTAKLLNCSLTKTQAALSVPTFYALVTVYHAFLMNCIIV